MIRVDRNTASSTSWVTNRMVIGNVCQMRITSSCRIARVMASTAENGSSPHRNSCFPTTERARDADALLHAAGELVRIVVLVALEADEIDVFTAALARLLPRHRTPRA